MKKILVIGLWVVLSAGLIVLMSFAVRSHESRLCDKLEISIDRRNADLFIRNADVEKLLNDHAMNPVGKELATVDVPALEKLLLTHPAVEACEVFSTIGGSVHIQIRQRRVVARFINLSGESFYVDDRGMLMPWSDEYTAPVLLVNGAFADGYAGYYRHSLNDQPEDSAMKTPTMLDDAWQIVRRIEADSFLQAQIVQLYYTPQKKFVLVPRIGDQSIVFGDASEIDEKFRKLLVFYREGLDRTGRWNMYSTINLEYRNQIVCTKKTN